MAFEKLLGQNEVKDKLSRALLSGKLSHAYIFSGEKGIGKKTFAAEFAAAAMCLNPADGCQCGRCRSCVLLEGGNNPDLMQISADDGKSSIGVDKIREDLRETVVKAPNFSSKRVFIVNEAEKMNEAAQNALLKTFEEPPEYVMIILLCDNVLTLLETIKSRAVTVEFKRNTDAEILEKYRQIRASGGQGEFEGISEKLLLSYADGIIGRIYDIAADRASTEKRRKLAGLLPQLFEGRFDARRRAAEIIEVKKKQYDFVFFSMMSFVRDAMVLARFGGRSEIINEDMREPLLTLAQNAGYYRLKEALEEIDSCYKSLGRNAMAEFAVDRMLIGLGEA